MDLHRPFLLFSSLAAIFGGISLLAACATSGTPTFIHTCPSMPTYTKAFEQQAGAELAKLPPNAPLARMVEDYIALRAAVRQCK